MSKLNWDDIGKTTYNAGVDRGVFYPNIGSGIVWNGLLHVQNFLDGSAILEAITYPDDFLPFDGYTKLMFAGQIRPLFNLSYRTLMGNGAQEHDYKLHLLYNCLAIPSLRHISLLNNKPDESTFTWDLSTTAVAIRDAKPSAHIILDATQVDPKVMIVIENYLYGTDSIESAFPTVAQLFDMFENVP